MSGGIYMKHRRHRRGLHSWTGTIISAVVLVLTVIVVIRTDKAVRRVAQQQAEHYAKLTANMIVSKAVSDYLDENMYTYSDFAAVLYDETGKAVSIETITYNINKVQSGLSTAINSEFEKNNIASAEIPIGSLSGSYLLAGKGPCLRIRICPSDTAEISLTSSFEPAGVNQTCHRISAVVTADITSSLPLYSFSETVSFEFLLAENIIVGEVPDSYIIMHDNF
jgi:sporulation protein YunB